MIELERIARFPRSATTEPLSSEDWAACRRILVPLDGTASAEGILPYVETVAPGFDAEVILLRAVPSTGHRFLQSIPCGLLCTTIPSKAQIDALDFQTALDKKAAQKYLMGVRLRLLRAGITSRYQVLEGSPSAAIVEYARDAGVSIIAMSIQGHGGLRRLVFGSVADDVLRNLPDVPMLLMRRSEPVI